MERSKVEQSLINMMTIAGHRVERDVLKKSKAQVFFLEGEDSLGKKECVLEWVRMQRCTAPKKDGGPCCLCKGCLRNIFFSDGDIFWLVLQNRLPYFSFLLKRYAEVGSLKKDRGNVETAIECLRLQISRELMRVLYLHRSGVLPLIGETKKSFSQGVSLSQQQLEDLLSEVYQWVDHGWLSLGYEGEKVFSAKHLAHVAKSFSLLQNSLDQSVITKKSLEKMFHFCQRQNADVPRFVFIDPVEKIHFSLVTSLLKILEEPPEGLFFFLGGSQIDTLSKETLKPLLSRAVQLRFAKLKEKDLIDVAEKKWFADLDRQELEKIFSMTQVGLEEMGRGNFKYLWSGFRFSQEEGDFEEVDAHWKNSSSHKLFPEHAKLIAHGGFKNGQLQFGLLLALFSSIQVSLSQLLAETRYAISLLLEAKMLAKKMEGGFPRYLEQKNYRDCRILLRSISQLEVCLQKGILSERSVFLKWLVLIR